MVDKREKRLSVRDPFEGLPPGVNVLTRNEGSTIESVPLTDIDVGDTLFRLRPLAHIELLAENIRLVGQQVPIVLRLEEPSGKWQVVSGFRRLEAVRKLGQEAVAARLFDQLSQDEAIKSAVSENFFCGDLTGEHIDAFMKRLREKNVLGGTGLAFLDWARERLSRVSAQRNGSTVGPDAGTTPDGEESLADLIDRTFVHLSEASQGIERIFLHWHDVTAADRKLLASECKYVHDLYPFLIR